jgi:peptide/nickel transport system ATP-binding protein
MKIDRLHLSHNDNVLVDISFSLGKSTALVGQSGSGKSLTLKAILGMLPSSLKVDYQVSSAPPFDHIGYVPQNPFTSLSPLTKIKDQFFCAKERQIELMKLVDLSPDSLEKFPMQLSGGQLQRIVIALALSGQPKLLLLDEPTTALDTINKELIMELLQTIQKKMEIQILFVTHDIYSIESLCEEMIILQKGKIVEQGSTKELLALPAHPYTKELIQSSFKNRQFRE